MQSGELTVTGEGKTIIVLRGRPREAVATFKPDHGPVPCDPHPHHHHDELKIKIEHEDENMREHHKPGHHHRERQFFLVIEWKVSSVREIDWFVFY